MFEFPYIFSSTLNSISKSLWLVLDFAFVKFIRVNYVLFLVADLGLSVSDLQWVWQVLNGMIIDFVDI